MDAISRLANDLISWYWWISVVLVGLLINLASAYLKPPIDNWLASRSERRRAILESKDAEFNNRTSEIAADPTLLLLEGQKAAHAETKTQLLFTLIGVNLVLLFVMSSLPEPRGGVVTSVMALLSASLPLHRMSVIKAMRNESAIEERFRAARRKYKREA